MPTKFGKYRRIRRNGSVAVTPSVLRWSDPASWGGVKPQAGDNVIIPVGTTYLLDENTADIGVLTINGTLRVDPQAADIKLQCDGLLVSPTGSWELGSVGFPHQGKFHLEPNAARPAGVVVGPSHDFNNVSANNPNDSFMGVAGLARGIIIQDGGSWFWRGQTPTFHRTKLAASASASANNLVTADDLTGWKQNQSVIVAPTGYYENQNTEFFTLAADAAGSAVTLNAGLAKPRWGLMQYLTDTSVSLTPGTLTKPNAGQRDYLDQRAKVALLSRNTRIGAPNDSEWSTKRFGVHIMIMGLSSTFIMDGAEIFNCGQGGLLGRYPIHWHMLSYNPTTGANLGNADATKHSVKNCAIWNSANRGITIHGTRGVEARDNVMYGVIGHCFFLEDGSEEDNIIVGNWVGRVRNPQFGEAALTGVAIASGDTVFNKVAHGLANGLAVRFPSTAPGGFSQYISSLMNQKSYWVVNATADAFQLAASPGGAPIVSTTSGSYQVMKNWCIKAHDNIPSGFWITNLNNEIRLNSAFDVEKIGFWNSLAPTRAGFPGGCFGLSSQVAIHPYHTQPKLDGLGNPLYNDNESHSNGQYGSQLEFPVNDEQGNTVVSPNNGARFRVPATPTGSDVGVNGNFGRQYNWKNQEGGYQNRVVNPIYTFWVQSDNKGTDFFGATLEAHQDAILAPVVINYSLNNNEPTPSVSPLERNAFASYHSSIDFIDVLAYNYTLGTPFINPEQKYSLMAGGVMQTWDLYTNPVEVGAARHRNWKLINSVPLYRTPPAHIVNPLYNAYTGGQQMDTNGLLRRWTLAGAIYDHTGALGTPGQQYIIFNHPYLTYGLTASSTPAPADLMVRYTPDHFYGILPKGDDTGDYSLGSGYTTPAQFQRLDATLSPVAGALWDLPDSSASSFFTNMKHATCPRGGYVRLTLPVRGIQSSFLHFSITNCKRKAGVNATADDFFYFVVPWSGAVAPRVTAAVGNISAPTWQPQAADYTVGRAKDYASVASLAALQSSAGLTYWRDTANNRLVLKIASHAHSWSFFQSASFDDNPRSFDLIVKPA